MIEEPERQLLDQARKGDLEAFSYLVEKYSTRLFGACLNLLGNRQDAEDCVQDTFIKAFRSIKEYNYLSAFYTWIYRIAINTCLDFRRKNRKNNTVSLDESLETEDSQVFIQIADRAPLPDEVAESTEIQEMIRQEISQLPQYLQEILILRDLEGFSYQELANMLQLSQGTVKSRLSRARHYLMERIRSREQSASGHRLTDKPE